MLLRFPSSSVPIKRLGPPVAGVEGTLQASGKALRHARLSRAAWVHDRFAECIRLHVVTTLMISAMPIHSPSIRFNMSRSNLNGPADLQLWRITTAQCPSLSSMQSQTPILGSVSYDGTCTCLPCGSRDGTASGAEVARALRLSPGNCYKPHTYINTSETTSPLYI